MQRREAMIAIGSGAAAAVAGCLGSATQDDEDPQNDGNNESNENNESDEPTDEGAAEDEPTTEQQGTRLQVTGQGSVETDPNKAVVSLAVEATGDSAEGVRDQISSDSESVRQALLDAGLEEDQITTGYYRIRERRREGGYEGVHSYEVELFDVDRVGEIVDTAVDAGADSVGHINFTITEERREELRDDALEEAVDDARDEAETVAATQEKTIARVEEMSTDGHRVSPYTHRLEVGLQADGEAAAASTSIDEGPVTVSASVVVVYVID